MGRCLNRQELIGHVGQTPTIRATASNIVVADFSLATTYSQKDQQGNWQDTTEWHNLVAFKKTAEVVRDYVKKGSRLYVDGRTQTQSWKDKDTGQDKSRKVVIVNNITLLDPPPQDRKTERGDDDQNAASHHQSPDYGDQGITDEDVPW